MYRVLKTDVDLFTRLYLQNYLSDLLQTLYAYSLFYINKNPFCTFIVKQLRNSAIYSVSLHISPSGIEMFSQEFDKRIKRFLLAKKRQSYKKDKILIFWLARQDKYSNDIQKQTKIIRVRAFFKIYTYKPINLTLFLIGHPVYIYHSIIFFVM